MTTVGRSTALGRAVMSVLTLAGAAGVADVATQAIAIVVVADALHVKAQTFTFIEGPVLARLRDGQSVRVELDLTAYERRETSPVAKSAVAFDVSFDLWEERFAVTRAGTPPKSISHVTSHQAEAWCIDQLAIPVADLKRAGRLAEFWLGLRYRAQKAIAPPVSAGDTASTLGTLIDILSRRRVETEPEKRLDAGPFRLPG